MNGDRYFSKNGKFAGNLAFSGFNVILITLLWLVSGCNPESPQALSCMERAVFGDPATSAYVLPYPVGKSYYCVQAYCNPDGGHRDKVAYDFKMPIGEEVTAARAGVVRKTRQDQPDLGNETDPGTHNHILIQHEDGTVTFYAHLKQNSLLVQVGDKVQAGQRIAASGNSGNTLGEPHLHFGVYQSWPAREGFDVAVNFRNTNGPLDDRGALIPGMKYEALGF